MLDGGEINSAGGGVRPMVGQEAVREFQVSRSNYSWPRTVGAGRNRQIVTRSGTNRGTVPFRLHGAAPGCRTPFALVIDADNKLKRLSRIRMAAVWRHAGRTGCARSGPSTF